jgi:ATP-dependent Clp protease ATP-binding subunit ClpA
MSGHGHFSHDGNVVELARTAAEAFNPGEGLSAVAELRRRLDSVEIGYVEDAVYEGWSWRRIADCLGVSRQAAHRRYAPSLKAKRRRWHRLRGRVGFSVEMGRAVRRATAEAQTMEHRRVDEGHLLLGLLCEECPACAPLTNSGASIPRLREQITRLHGGAPLLSGTVTLDADPSPSPDEVTRLPLTALAKRALRESADEAARLHSREVEPEHLLLALLRPTEGTVAKLLLRMGLRAEDVRDEVQTEISREPTR